MWSRLIPALIIQVAGVVIAEILIGIFKRESK
jgi:hypothetical protein